MRSPMASNTMAVAAVTVGAVSHHFHMIQEWIWTYWTEGVTEAKSNLAQQNVPLHITRCQVLN